MAFGSVAIFNAADVQAATPTPTQFANAAELANFINSLTPVYGAYVHGANVVTTQFRNMADLVAFMNDALPTQRVGDARFPVSVTAEMLAALNPSVVLVDSAGTLPANAGVRLADFNAFVRSFDWGSYANDPTTTPPVVPVARPVFVGDAAGTGVDLSAATGVNDFINPTPPTPTHRAWNLPEQNIGTVLLGSGVLLSDANLALLNAFIAELNPIATNVSIADDAADVIAANAPFTTTAEVAANEALSALIVDTIVTPPPTTPDYLTPSVAARNVAAHRNRATQVFGTLGAAGIGGGSMSQGESVLIVHQADLTQGAGLAADLTRNVTVEIDPVAAEVIFTGAPTGWGFLSSVMPAPAHASRQSDLASQPGFELITLADGAAGIYFRGVHRIAVNQYAFGPTWAERQADSAVLDAITGAGNWTAVPYVLRRFDNATVELAFVVEHARSITATGVANAGITSVGGGGAGSGFIFFPLHFVRPAADVDTIIRFSGQSDVLPNATRPVHITQLGNRVVFGSNVATGILGGGMVPHSVNSQMASINIIENQVGALIQNTTNGMPVQRLFRVVLPVDNAFFSTQHIRFGWVNANFGSGGGFMRPVTGTANYIFGASAVGDTGSVSLSINPALLTAITNGSAAYAPHNTIAARYSNLPVGDRQNAFINDLRAGSVPAGDFVQALGHHTQHVAFITEPGVGHQQQLVVVLAEVPAAARQTGLTAQLQIGWHEATLALRPSITHRNHQSPVFGAVTATVWQGAAIAHMTGGSGVIANLGTGHLQLVAAPAQGGLPATMVSGRLYGTILGQNIPRNTHNGAVVTPNAPMVWWGAAVAGGGPARTVGAEAMLGASRRVRLEETHPMSAPPHARFNFILTDADGYPLEGARIAAVQINTNALGSTVNSGIQGAWQNRVGSQGAAGTARHNGTFIAGSPVGTLTGGAAPGITGNAMVHFSDEGNAVAVQGVSLNAEATDRMAMDLRFWISTAPDFEGNVYVTVDDNVAWWDQFIGFDPNVPITGNTLHIATFRRAVHVEAVSTNAHIGFMRQDVGSITVREVQHGDLRLNGTVELSLTENIHAAAWAHGGRTFTDFWPVRIANISAGTGANAPLVTPSTRQLAGEIELLIGRASRVTPATIVISDIEARLDWAVPHGNVALIARGDAILNNDYFEMNTVWANNVGAVGAVGAHRLLGQNEVGYRRYGHTGIVIEDYIRVVTPGAGAAHNVQNSVRIPWASSPSFELALPGQNFATRSFANVAGDALTSINVDGRVFVPVRSVIEALGGTIDAILNDDGIGVRAVRASMGGTVVEWTIGSVNYTVTGGARPGTWTMTTDNIHTRPFIATYGTNGGNNYNNDTTFLPIRYIADAFDLRFDLGDGYTIINPR
jgi:hypothetical protein